MYKLTKRLALGGTVAMLLTFLIVLFTDANSLQEGRIANAALVATSFGYGDYIAQLSDGWLFALQVTCVLSSFMLSLALFLFVLQVWARVLRSSSRNMRPSNKSLKPTIGPG